MATQISKRLVIGRRQWGIPDADAEGVSRDVEDAMMNRTQVRLQLLDPHEGHTVTVFLNGAAASSVELDLLKGPRPSEMS